MLNAKPQNLRGNFLSRLESKPILNERFEFSENPERAEINRGLLTLTNHLLFHGSKTHLEHEFKSDVLLNQHLLKNPQTLAQLKSTYGAGLVLELQSLAESRNWSELNGSLIAKIRRWQNVGQVHLFQALVQWARHEPRLSPELHEELRRVLASSGVSGYQLYGSHEIVEQGLRRFGSGVFEGGLIAAMLMGGPFGLASRAQTLHALARMPSRILSRGAGANLFSSGIGLLFESAGALLGIRIYRGDFDRDRIGEEYRGLVLSLGLMKLGGTYFEEMKIAIVGRYLGFSVGSAIGYSEKSSRPWTSWDGCLQRGIEFFQLELGGKLVQSLAPGLSAWQKGLQDRLVRQGNDAEGLILELPELALLFSPRTALAETPYLDLPKASFQISDGIPLSSGKPSTAIALAPKNPSLPRQPSRLRAWLGRLPIFSRFHRVFSPESPHPQALDFVTIQKWLGIILNGDFRLENFSLTDWETLEQPHHLFALSRTPQNLNVFLLLLKHENTRRKSDSNASLNDPLLNPKGVAQVLKAVEFGMLEENLAAEYLIDYISHARTGYSELTPLENLRLENLPQGSTPPILAFREKMVAHLESLAQKRFFSYELRCKYLVALGFLGEPGKALKILQKTQERIQRRRDHFLSYFTTQKRELEARQAQSHLLLTEALLQLDLKTWSPNFWLDVIRRPYTNFEVFIEGLRRASPWIRERLLQYPETMRADIEPLTRYLDHRSNTVTHPEQHGADIDGFLASIGYDRGHKKLELYLESPREKLSTNDALLRIYYARELGLAGYRDSAFQHLQRLRAAFVKEAASKQDNPDISVSFKTKLNAEAVEFHFQWLKALHEIGLTRYAASHLRTFPENYFIENTDLKTALERSLLLEKIFNESLRPYRQEPQSPPTP